MRNKNKPQGKAKKSIGKRFLINLMVYSLFLIGILIMLYPFYISALNDYLDNIRVTAYKKELQGIYKSKQEELKKEVKRHAECLDRDNKRIAEQEEMTRLTLRGVNALLNHEITGNGIENLKKVRDDITEHLIDK